MAQYKVPQDVEADDKLIGPFSFRQFVYLMVAGGLIAAAVGMFQLFPVLAIIPVPFAFFFLALALPLKKDQPMETYLAAVVSYYLKPHARKWMPGQKDTPILITAPKREDDNRTRDITEEEATHRLSFLADIVDTEGYAIKGAGASPMREDLVAEANATPDMFETYQSQVINRVIDQDKMSRHQSAVKEMQAAIARNNVETVLPEEPVAVGGEKVIQRSGAGVNRDMSNEVARAIAGPEIAAPAGGAGMAGAGYGAYGNMAGGYGGAGGMAGSLAGATGNLNGAVSGASAGVQAGETDGATGANGAGLRDYAILKPDVDIDSSDVLIRPEMSLKKEQKVTVPGMDYLMDRVAREKEANKGSGAGAANNGGNAEAATGGAEKVPTKPVNDSIMELANNTDFSVATIAKEANRINRKEQSEVFVSLH